MNHDFAAIHWSFRAVGRMYTALLQEAVQPHGLQEASQAIILLMLRNDPDKAQGQIAKALAISAATVAVSTRRMEKAGLLKKETDPDDLRRNRLTLTEKGLSVLEDCMQAFSKVDIDMFQGFSPEETGQLRGYYSRIIENLEHMGATAPGWVRRRACD